MKVGKKVTLLASLVCIFFCNMLNISYAKIDEKELFYRNKNSSYIDFNLTEKDHEEIKKISNYIRKGKWSKAISLSSSMTNEAFSDTMVDYTLWKKFTKLRPHSAEEEFANLTDFVIKNQFLPNIQQLKRKVEDIYIKEEIPFIYAKDYFKIFPPIQTDVAIQLLKDKSDFIMDESASEIEKDEILSNLDQDIRNVWVNKNFDKNQEKKFMVLFGLGLKQEDYQKKIERLLWEKSYSKAEKFFKFVDKKHKILYTSIIRINKNPKYINHILRSIPKELRYNELLLHARVRYYHKNRKKNEVLKVFYKMPDENFKHDKWWYYRKVYAREFLKNNDYKKSYYIASKHKLTKGADFAEAEWLSGWIALRFMDKPELAYTHFYNLYNNVNYPISLSKAAYWAGRALQESDREDKALYWYHIASKYPTYFYGQLAAYAKYDILDKKTAKEERYLPEKPEITNDDQEQITGNRIVKLAYLLNILGDRENIAYSKRLFKHSIDKAENKGQIAAILNIIKSIDNHRLTVLMTKHAVTKDVFFIEDLYPVLKIVKKDNPNNHLIHAIIKQESAFQIDAKSYAGALGFMQLMPDTAREVCRKVGVRYNKRRLTRDANYNIMLGSQYISSLLNHFQGSEVLAIASYNAGPSAVKRWINLFGDPRTYKDIKDIVDWVELITYGQTRDYVQRVIENSIVYEYVLEAEELG